MTRWEMLVLEVRSSEMCTPRYLKLETSCTVDPPMCRGGTGFLSQLKSTAHSLVFVTLMQRL